MVKKIHKSIYIVFQKAVLSHDLIILLRYYETFKQDLSNEQLH